MKKYFCIFILSGLLFSGCASLPEYNPVSSALKGEYLLNGAGFAVIKTGMTIAEVHKTFGDSLTVGYTLDTDGKTYKPQTIPNPFKAEMIKSASGQYAVEYYVSRIAVPDGIVSDEELTPVIFQNGILVSTGWDALKSLAKK